MAATALIQVKLEPTLKQTLERLADFYGLTLSSFVKMKLTETGRVEKEKIAASTPVTHDPEDAFLVHHEAEIVKTLQRYLKNPKNIAEVVHIDQ